jgi:hypothetical protein
MKIVKSIPSKGDYTVYCYPNRKIEIFVPTLFDIIKSKFNRFFKIGWTHFKLVRK